MLTKKKLTLMGAAGALSALLLSPMAQAATYSDAQAAVLVWAKIAVDDSRDTVVQLTNASNTPAAAHCFYVNANSRCSNNGQVCTDSSECAEGLFFGTCLPGWIEINFDVVLTPEQPLAWSAAEGLGNSQPAGIRFDTVPCPGGLLNSCPGSNAGTRVPPVGESPFIGELKCIQTDPITRLPTPCGLAGQPACRNDLEGSATIETIASTGEIDAQRYNAVGLRTAGPNDGDHLLVIGGPTGAEYQPCAQVLVFNHLFDGAIDPTNDPVSGPSTASSELTLVPCTENFLEQHVPQVIAQFLVYNEYEQRFSTSRLVNCLLDSPISNIDTSQSNRSIFSAAVAGTVAGQTRITGVNGGLIGAATLSFSSASSPTAGAGYNLNQFADRQDADFIRIP